MSDHQVSEQDHSRDQCQRYALDDHDLPLPATVPLHSTMQMLQGNRTYQTSPALCNPTTPFAADKPHRLSSELFRILFVPAWPTEQSRLLPLLATERSRLQQMRH